MNNHTEELWQFPCDFPIKIVGKATTTFETFVFSTVHKHFPQLKENAIETRLSKDGTYLAITVIVQAENKAQLDALYLELTADKEVLFAI